MTEELLKVTDLSFSFKTKYGDVHAVRNVSFSLRSGEVLGIVGESGCGKTVTSQCIARLNPEPPGYFLGGRILFEGRSVTEMDRKQLENLRAREIGYIFQNPYESLNPTMKVGRQVEEALLFEKSLSAVERKRRAVEVLKRVGLDPVELRYDQYPHELSGGMRQRVIIAMALIRKPKLLICDEPTTALDVTTEAEILSLLNELIKESGISMLIITHNIGIIARMCDRLIVMYGGEVVESGTAETLLTAPGHPYLRDLRKSVITRDMDKKDELPYIPGMPPDLRIIRCGCSYAERCSLAGDRCYHEKPEALFPEEEHMVSCHLVKNEHTGQGHI